MCIYMCVRRRDFWPLKTCGVLSSSTVSILSDPLGCSTHIQHPSLSAIFLHARLSCSLFPPLFLSVSHRLSASIAPLLHFLSSSRQRQQISTVKPGGCLRNKHVFTVRNMRISVQPVRSFAAKSSLVPPILLAPLLI